MTADERKDPMPKPTFSSFAEAFKDEDRGGRFKPEQATIIVGTTPITNYKGAGQVDPVPDEPPLGYRDEMQPVGTAAEVKAPIDRLRKDNGEA
jgi:hypothetical protein